MSKILSFRVTEVQYANFVQLNTQNQNRSQFLNKVMLDSISLNKTLVEEIEHLKSVLRAIDVLVSEKLQQENLDDTNISIAESISLLSYFGY